MKHRFRCVCDMRFGTQPNLRLLFVCFVCVNFLLSQSVFKFSSAQLMHYLLKQHTDAQPATMLTAHSCIQQCSLFIIINLDVRFKMPRHVKNSVLKCFDMRHEFRNVKTKKRWRKTEGKKHQPKQINREIRCTCLTISENTDSIECLLFEFLIQNVLLWNSEATFSNDISTLSNSWEIM